MKMCLELLVRYFLRECEKEDRRGGNSYLIPLIKLCPCKKNRNLRKAGIDCLCFLGSSDTKDIRDDIREILKDYHEIQASFDTEIMVVMLNWSEIRYNSITC
jgi:hypothetical protein